MKYSKIWRVLIGSAALVSMSSQLAATPLSLAFSRFDLNSFSLSGDVSFANPEPMLQADLFIIDDHNDTFARESGGANLALEIATPDADAYGGDVGNGAVGANTLAASDNAETTIAGATLKTSYNFFNNSFGDVGVSVDYNLFGFLSLGGNFLDSAFTSAAFELRIFDDSLNELFFFENFFDLRSDQGSNQTQDIFRSFDQSFSLDIGNYIVELANVSYSQVAVSKVPEPSSALLLLSSLLLLSRYSKKRSLIKADALAIQQVG